MPHIENERKRMIKEAEREIEEMKENAQQEKNQRMIPIKLQQIKSRKIRALEKRKNA